MHTTVTFKRAYQRSNALQAVLNGLNSMGADGTPPAAAATPADDVDADAPIGFGVKQVLTEPKDHQQFIHIGGRQLVGLYLTVWARKPVAEHVSAWQVRALWCTFA